MKRVKAIRAKVVFIPTGEGGRREPVFSGYRPAIYCGEHQTDGEINLEQGDIGLLGEELLVKIRLLHPEHLGDELKPSAKFQIKEAEARYTESSPTRSGLSS